MLPLLKSFLYGPELKVLRIAQFCMYIYDLMTNMKCPIASHGLISGNGTVRVRGVPEDLLRPGLPQLSQEERARHARRPQEGVPVRPLWNLTLWQGMMGLSI